MIEGGRNYSRSSLPWANGSVYSLGAPAGYGSSRSTGRCEHDMGEKGDSPLGWNRLGLGAQVLYERS